MLFAVIRHDKPNSLALRLSERPRHLEYLKTVLDKIMYGGALLDDEGKQIGSMLIIDVADQGSRRRLRRSPIPTSRPDLFASTSVRPVPPGVQGWRLALRCTVQSHRSRFWTFRSARITV